MQPRIVSHHDNLQVKHNKVAIYYFIDLGFKKAGLLLVLTPEHIKVIQHLLDCFGYQVQHTDLFDVVNVLVQLEHQGHQMKLFFLNELVRLTIHQVYHVYFVLN